MLGRALGLAAMVAGLMAPLADASFDCGTPLSRCFVQIDNSGRAWFESNEKLTEDALGDGSPRNGVFQIYERVGSETLLVSRGLDGKPIPVENKQNISAWLRGVSADGERVYMRTEAALAPEDGDAGHEGGSLDDYVLSNGTYTLISTGPLDGPAPNPNPYTGDQNLWASDDGQHVYFATGQQLVAADFDTRSDIYERSGGQTRLVSTGPDQARPTPEFPNPDAPETRFLGASADGATAYFATAEHLTADDTDKFTSDIFSWHDGVTRRITHTVFRGEGPGVPYESFDPYSFAGAGTEGSVYFTANSPQTPDDTDANTDVYQARPDGSLVRLITAPPGTVDELGIHPSLRVEAVSRDGSRLFLSSNVPLVAEDHDTVSDVYMWSAGRYELVTPDGQTKVKDEELQLCSISGSGQRAYFQTRARLSPSDGDEEPDVYEWREGSVRLVSPASDGRQSAAFCRGISPNGRYVAFMTFEELLPGDTDAGEDIYVIDMGAPSAGDSAAASASAAAAKPAKRHRRRLRLVTAEAIAPRIAIAPNGVLADGTARVRLTCPRSERSDPCHGRAKLLQPKTHRPLAAGSFRIGAGRTARVTLTGTGVSHRRRTFRALVRVRGADMLGNRRTVSATVRLRRLR